MNKENNHCNITVRNLNKDFKFLLRIKAAKNNRSMEEEARLILERAVLSSDDEQELSLAKKINLAFADIGGIDLPELAREPLRDNIKFD